MQLDSKSVVFEVTNVRPPGFRVLATQSIFFFNIVLITPAELLEIEDGLGAEGDAASVAEGPDLLYIENSSEIEVDHDAWNELAEDAGGGREAGTTSEGRNVRRRLCESRAWRE